MKVLEYTWKDSLSLMGWGVENDGLSVIFVKVIPEFITKNLPNVLNKFPLKNFCWFIIAGSKTLCEILKTPLIDIE